MGLKTQLTREEKIKIATGVSSVYFVKSGSSYGTVRVEVIHVDDEGKVTVDGAMYGATTGLICTFTNSVIGDNWLLELEEK
jgi:hypothetical protein